MGSSLPPSWGPPLHADARGPGSRLLGSASASALVWLALVWLASLTLLAWFWLGFGWIWVGFRLAFIYCDLNWIWLDMGWIWLDLA